MYRQINDTFFLLITVFDTKISYLPAWESLQRGIVFTAPVTGVLDIPVFSISIHTQLSKKDVESWAGKKPNTKEKMAGKNAIFMLRESGSWKHQSQWHENCQQEQIITQREFILMTMTLMR